MKHKMWQSNIALEHCLVSCLLLHVTVMNILLKITYISIQYVFKLMLVHLCSNEKGLLVTYQSFTEMSEHLNFLEAFQKLGIRTTESHDFLCLTCMLVILTCVFC